MKKLVFTSTFVFFLCLASVAEVKACSCLSSPNENLQFLVKKAYRDSRAVFSGRVLKITRNESLQHFKVRFRLEKSWKQKLSREITITTALDSAACGVSFEVGKKYLVYASGDGKNLETNICTRTSLLARTNRDLAALNKIKRPIFLK